MSKGALTFKQYENLDSALDSDLLQRLYDTVDYLREQFPGLRLSRLWVKPQDVTAAVWEDAVAYTKPDFPYRKDTTFQIEFCTGFFTHKYQEKTNHKEEPWMHNGKYLETVVAHEIGHIVEVQAWDSQPELLATAFQELSRALLDLDGLPNQRQWLYNLQNYRPFIDGRKNWHIPKRDVGKRDLFVVMPSHVQVYGVRSWQTRYVTPTLRKKLGSYAAKNRRELFAESVAASLYGTKEFRTLLEPFLTCLKDAIAT